MTPARAFHLITAVVTLAALLLQLVLSVSGAAVLLTEEMPSLGTRLWRLVSYFTIQSNILVAVSTVMLARDPQRDGQVFRIVRLAGLVGITVTGLVHFFLLRPLLDLTGWSAVVDTLLHVVVPVLCVTGWLVAGPRSRIDATAIAGATLWPVLWLAATLAVGGATDWFPYPFVNFREEGWPAVVVTCLGILVLFAALFVAVWFADRRLGRTREREPHS
ncbi:Pr6Pr family membrane protein [Ruania suaedae]|uniref:Pr6Pr family membrane protein n=1 Tax=Ruania suaedae TaxID=2897774 RepID=UPI001E3FD9F5|nr:Pr6Pr family membrane protein [Ruania suaedae]UFU03798.1 Pr6Pr family membrane protein [Ruania suaedae]